MYLQDEIYDVIFEVIILLYLYLELIYRLFGILILMIIKFGNNNKVYVFKYKNYCLLLFLKLFFLEILNFI